ncbi:MAG: pilus assembly protein PilP [Archangium sp.]
MKRIVLALLAATAVLSACGDETPDAVAPPPSAAKKKAAAPVAAATTTQVDYVYSSLNKRDPFRSFTERVVGPTPGVNPEIGDGCSEPLCKMDLDELTVVAVVSGDANPLAMLEDRTGVGHLVRRNTRMGKQGGKVVQILRDCIVVLSFVTGGADGKPQPVKQNLCVRPDDQSKNPLDLLRNKEFVP